MDNEAVTSGYDSDPGTPSAPVILRISPMAHIAVGVLTLGLLAVVLPNPVWLAPLFVIPVVLSACVIRYRTVADRNEVTARTLLGSRTTRWEDIEGLRFDRGSWAIAHLKDGAGGSDLRLPAVTFATLPALAEISGGRVPNPYQ